MEIISPRIVTQRNVTHEKRTRVEQSFHELHVVVSFYRLCRDTYYIHIGLGFSTNHLARSISPRALTWLLVC